jgi:outer membrane receptor protein involved in Fe transport
MRRAFVLAVISLLLPGPLFAGTTGKVRGRVTERGSEGLAGANVAILGTQLGAATGVDGEYVIINIPPGTYELRVTMVGFGPLTVRQVRVIVDQTTTIDVRLTESAVQLADVIVEAERPMVQRDLTATRAVISSEQIKALPVKNFAEVVQIQAGVVGDGNTLHIRGGRGNEVAYLIDGTYVRDPVLGSLGTAINNDAIAELNVLSGTFNAEYGNALSGVVNIITKEGGSKFAGSIEGRTSEFDIFSPADSPSRYEQMRENRVSGTVGGPITGDDFTFFASGERDARSNWLPFGSETIISGLAKLAVRPVPALKVVGTGRYSETFRRPYNHEWKYIPEQYLRVREYSRQGILAVTHSVMPSLFYDVRFSYFNQSFYSGLDKDTSLYVPASEWLWGPQGNGREFWSLADPLDITNNRTETFDLKADLVWQLGRVNELKTGVQLKKYNLWYINIFDPTRDNPYVTDFTKNPVEAAIYVQDKIELRSLVVNLGLRVDYMNQQSPYRSDPLDPSSVVESTPKTHWSPRLGVAHPISDRTSLHFSYGHFFQIPTYDRFFENAQYDISVREPLFGNPNLDAERKISYEVGLSHQFSPTLAATFTAQYTDVTGLIGTQYFFPFVEGRYVGYTIYVNDDYANVRGFEVSLVLRRTYHVSGSLTYTYQTATGSASSETEDYPAAYKSTRLYPLDWDRTHILNINVNLGWGEREGPDVFGFMILENTSWNFLLRAATGLPYTPSGRDIAFVPKNSARIPANAQLDFQVLKEWEFPPLTFGVFFEALNLLDTENIRSVYTDTGLPDFTTFGNHSAEYMADPSSYYPPRRMRLGARIMF